MKAENLLFTIGYAGYELDSFLQRLNEYSIEMVVDVRRNPVSRKKGFSRSRLAEFLTSHGVEYAHMRELGVPTELRNKLRGGECDLAEYFARFREYLDGQDGSLKELAELASRKRCCLLCVEQRPEDCHRSVVVEMLARKKDWSIVDI